jgi:transcriptional regulator with XRE-family HTH domain
MSEMGSALRQLRIEADCTQEALSEKIGVSQEYISRIETGKAFPSWRFLVNFARAVGANLVTLLRDAGLMEPDSLELEQEIAALMEEDPLYHALFVAAKELRDAGDIGNRELEEVVRYVRYRLQHMHAGEEQSGTGEDHGMGPVGT